MPEKKLELKIPSNLTRLVKKRAEEYRISMKLAYIEIFRQYFESLENKTLEKEIKGSFELIIPADLYQSLMEFSVKQGRTINAICIEMIEWFFLTVKV